MDENGSFAPNVDLMLHLHLGDIMKQFMRWEYAPHLIVTLMFLGLTLAILTQ